MSSPWRAHGTALLLAHARVEHGAGWETCDVELRAGHVTRVHAPGRGPLEPGLRRVDLDGRWLLPGWVNAHDHLGLSSYPALGRPPYPSLYAWADDVRAGQGDARAAAAAAVPLSERLFLGGLRGLLAGVTAVAHHDPWHATLGPAGEPSWRARWRRWRSGGPWNAVPFPQRVLRAYGQAHSPGLEPDLPASHAAAGTGLWMIHAAEGHRAQVGGELRALDEAGLLGPRTLLVHALGIEPADVGRIARSGAAVVWCPESNRNLYAAQAPVGALRAAGVRLALGSDSPLSGVRDALSNLALARACGVWDDRELRHLASGLSAAVLGLPVGGFEPGAPADFMVAESVERLLAGERTAVSLVLLGGRALYGHPDLLRRLEPDVWPLEVEGQPRALARPLGRRLAWLLRRYPQLHAAAWLRDVRCR